MLDEKPTGNGIQLFDPETARAIQEFSKATRTLLETLTKGGSYAAAVFGQLPHNTVGIVGDWVLHKRIRRAIELERETEAILKARKVDNREDPSPSIATPLLEAALDEDREHLREMWAKLLAAAIDPTRRHLI